MSAQIIEEPLEEAIAHRQHLRAQGIVVDARPVHVERDGKHLLIELDGRGQALHVDSAGRARALHQLIRDINRALPDVALQGLLVLALDASDIDHPIGERPPELHMRLLGSWVHAARMMPQADTTMQDWAWSVVVRHLFMGLLS